MHHPFLNGSILHSLAIFNSFGIPAMGAMVQALGCEMLIGKQTVYLALVAAVIALSAGTQRASATEVQAQMQTPAVFSVALLLPGNQKGEAQSAVRPAHDSWEFFSCVQSADDCEDQAHNDGYHHHRVVHDHHACEDEPHLACYVK